MAKSSKSKAVLEGDWSADENRPGSKPPEEMTRDSGHYASRPREHGTAKSSQSDTTIPSMR